MWEVDTALHDISRYTGGRRGQRRFGTDMGKIESQEVDIVS